MTRGFKIAKSREVFSRLHDPEGWVGRCTPDGKGRRVGCKHLATQLSCPSLFVC